MVNQHFLPPVDPYHTGTLAVDDIHTIHYEECGNPDGQPILFVHGGPGVGCFETDRRFYDPKVFRIILVDQRGSGKSTPAGEIRNNNIDDLVADFELLRKELGIEQWHVFGGSWGSTLSLYYAEQCPDSVKTLVLRGIWMLREKEVHWWFYEMGQLQPELWQRFADLLPEDQQDDILEGYWKLLTGDDREVALEAARRWSVYEGSSCTLLPNPEFENSFAEDSLAWNMARIEAHYFRNQRFEQDDHLLANVDRIRHIPAFAVHGRYDIICPVKNLTDLGRAWPELDTVIVPDAGHSSHEAGITKELVAAVQRIADTGNPTRRSS